MILITTAGKVGSASADQLAGLGVPVRLLARHPEKAAGLAQAGVEVFPGDLDSPESIDQAMRGVSRVILVTQPVLSQGRTPLPEPAMINLTRITGIMPMTVQCGWSYAALRISQRGHLRLPWWPPPNRPLFRENESPPSARLM